MADHMGVSNWTDLVLIEDTSDGINSVARSLAPYLYANRCRRDESDNLIDYKCKLLRFNTAYPMVTAVLDWINQNIQSTNDEVLVFNVTYSMINDMSLLLNKWTGAFLSQIFWLSAF